MKQGLRSIKGRFKPSNPDKYNGNVKKITYRSLWERRFMLYCDRSDQVFKWSSEELHIPYISPKDEKWHNYYPDFLVNTKDGRILLVEIKPKQQWNWKVNQAKWDAAKVYCEEQGWDFIVMGYKELYG